MANPLAPGFKLSERTAADWDELWRVMEAAYEEDEIWHVAFKACKKEDVHSWVMTAFIHRGSLPDTTFYKITEESTGYG
jgi:hypothetical protein